MFDKIRAQVQYMIEQHKANEVTRDSNFNNAGIYMLYVDCFTDEKIIPFYIGQTHDFQERHKQHFTEILALNRLNRECYEYALLADLYNGRARACKIFSYMVNHECWLKDLRMIVLETIDDEIIRLNAEQNYIDTLYAPFFGFNQLNSVIRSIGVYYSNENPEEYNIAKKQDIDVLLKFSSFGYGHYNWYRSCKSLYGTISSQGRLSELPDSYLTIYKNAKRLDEIALRRAEIRGYNVLQAEKEVWKTCNKTIDTYFAQYKLRSEEKKKLVVRVWIFDIDSDRNALEKYFAQYSDRIEENIFDVLERIHGSEILPIKQRVLNNQCEYRALEEEEEILSHVALGDLLPKQYVSHPLGDMEKTISFETSNDNNNVCYINIEFTGFKSSPARDYGLDVLRVDYYVINNGKTNSRTVYTNTRLSDFFSCDDVYYCESGFKYGPFNPRLRGRIDTPISIAMEYKNGINEWTLRDKATEDFKKVFKEINRLIDEKTKVIYTTSGYKSTILTFTAYNELSSTILAKKLKRLCK